MIKLKLKNKKLTFIINFHFFISRKHKRMKHLINMLYKLFLKTTKTQYVPLFSVKSLTIESVR
jgi:hypothetical protein